MTTDEHCRNIVDITAGRPAYIVSLMEIESDFNKRHNHLLWLQAMGLIETWFLI